MTNARVHCVQVGRGVCRVFFFSFFIVVIRKRVAKHQHKAKSKNYKKKKKNEEQTANPTSGRQKANDFCLLLVLVAVLAFNS